jgi:tetratricopeptide (TPR) repeat protein
MNKKQSPQQLADEAKSAYQQRNYEAAAALFASAAEAYMAQGDALMSAEMKNNQCVALLQAKQAQAALDVVSGTEAVFASAGDLRRQGMALSNQAATLEALKRREEAASLYERAAEILRQAGEDQLRADVMRSLAALKIRKGQGVDAVITMQDGLRGVKEPTLKQRILKKLLRFRLW